MATQSKFRLLVFLFMLVASCTPESTSNTPIKFQHPVFEIEYPSHWNVVGKKGMLLAMVKYSELEELIEGENPSFIIFSTDTANINTGDGTPTLEKYLTLFIEKQLANHDILLKDGLKETMVSNHELFSFSFKTQGAFTELLQNHYFFASSGQIVGIITKEIFDSPDAELHAMIASLVIKDEKGTDDMFHH